MKEYFKEQLDAGPTNGDPVFKVCYILRSPSGSNAVHTADSDCLDELDEDFKYASHNGPIPILTTK